ncbi:MAG: hypothetical protein HC848_06215 [Limnobacter sp.]|nr:hypothetical protein [Limnobacter sp.]
MFSLAKKIDFMEKLFLNMEKIKKFIECQDSVSVNILKINFDVHPNNLTVLLCGSAENIFLKIKYCSFFCGPLKSWGGNLDIFFEKEKQQFLFNTKQREIDVFSLKCKKNNFRINFIDFSLVNKAEAEAEAEAEAVCMPLRCHLPCAPVPMVPAEMSQLSATDASVIVHRSALVVPAQRICIRTTKANVLVVRARGWGD